MLRTTALIALRSCVIAAATALVTLVVVIVGEGLLPKPASSPDWGFGRLGVELWIGGAAGLVIGFLLAVRVGRRWDDLPARVLQTVAALAIPLLLTAGSWMERSHEVNTNLTVFDV